MRPTMFPKGSTWVETDGFSLTGEISNTWHGYTKYAFVDPPLEQAIDQEKVNMPQNKSSDLIKAIRKLDVHDHLCLIYESREEQLAAVIPFMRIGLERGERCIYIADDNTVKEVLDAMRAAGIEVEDATRSGALSVITKRDFYLKEGSFDPDWMIDFLKEATAAAKADGYSALRVTGEMTWMLGGDPGSERLIEYEAKLNYFIPEYDCCLLYTSDAADE